MKNNWYTTVSTGGGPYEMPPRGPWPSEEAALAAMARWESRVGELAGTIMAAHSVRIVGPYLTRTVARQVDISNYALNFTL